MFRSRLSSALAVAGGLFVAIQLVPYGWNHKNPPVVAEPAWNAPRTRELFFRACADCHSNESKWPWYSRVAPVSWLVYRDVQQGREHLNVSEWNRPQRHAHEAAEKLQEGEMPLPLYLPFHPEAQLTAAEKADLVAGLAATLGSEGDRQRGGKNDDEDDD
ncbi:MAG: heme-binding domain-containing protein [Thermoanaerobaculia bacterium]